jgi:hypothetical protein
MNAGSLDFRISANSADLVNAVNQADGALKRLRIDADFANAAMMKAVPFLPGGAGASAGSAMTAAALKSKSRALSASVGSVAMTASMFAGGDAASVVYPVMLIGKELKGLSGAMKLAGISMGAASAAGAVFTASVIAVTMAFTEYGKMREAQKQEEESIQNLSAQLEARRKTLFGAMDLAAQNDLIPKKEAEGWKKAYDYVSTDALRNRTLKAIGERLNEVGAAPRSSSYLNAQESFERLKLKIEAEASGELATKIQQVYALAGDKLKEAFNVATEAGKDFGPLRDAILKWRDDTIKEVQTEANKPAKIPEGKAPKAPKFADVTAIERMGGVLNGLGRGFGGDEARQTADNTRRLVVLTEQSVELNRFAGRGGEVGCGFWGFLRA